MTPKDFTKFAKERFEYCMKLLDTKSEEYATLDDKLHNFKMAAGVIRSTPEDALLGMMNKHITSIIDIIYELDEPKLPSKEKLAEKITDTINYLVLLEALITERLDIVFKEVADEIKETNLFKETNQKINKQDKTDLFYLTTREMEKIREWDDEHRKTCPIIKDTNRHSGILGRRLVFQFTSTGIGSIIKVKCTCGEEIDITDVSTW